MSRYENYKDLDAVLGGDTQLSSFLFTDLVGLQKYLKEGTYADELMNIFFSRYKLAKAAYEINTHAIGLVEDYIERKGIRPEAKPAAKAEKASSDGDKKAEKKENPIPVDQKVIDGLEAALGMMKNRSTEYKDIFNKYNDFKEHIIASYLIEHKLKDAHGTVKNLIGRSVEELIEFNKIALAEITKFLRGYALAVIVTKSCIEETELSVEGKKATPHNLINDTLHQHELALLQEIVKWKNVNSTNHALNVISTILLDLACQSKYPTHALDAHIHSEVLTAYEEFDKLLLELESELLDKAGIHKKKVIEQVRKLLKEALPKPKTMPLSQQRQEHIDAVTRADSSVELGPHSTPRGSWDIRADGVDTQVGIGYKQRPSQGAFQASKSYLKALKLAMPKSNHGIRAAAGLHELGLQESPTSPTSRVTTTAGGDKLLIEHKTIIECDEENAGDANKVPLSPEEVAKEQADLNSLLPRILDTRRRRTAREHDAAVVAANERSQGKRRVSMGVPGGDDVSHVTVIPQRGVSVAPQKRGPHTQRRKGHQRNGSVVSSLAASVWQADSADRRRASRVTPKDFSPKP